MLSYLDPADHPVISGLEKFELVLAHHQPQYRPLRALRDEGEQGRVLTRWTLTPQQREMIAKGADIFLELMEFDQPTRPATLSVGDDEGLEHYAQEYKLSPRQDAVGEKVGP